jgi:hypothetical protein
MATRPDPVGNVRKRFYGSNARESFERVFRWKTKGSKPQALCRCKADFTLASSNQADRFASGFHRSAIPGRDSVKSGRVPLDWIAAFGRIMNYLQQLFVAF